MLLLVLSLEAVTTISSRVAVPRPALRMSSNACTGNTACRADPDDRFRVAGNGAEPLIDRKGEALDGYWKRCETTGMPVCPATEGRLRYSTTVD